MSIFKPYMPEGDEAREIIEIIKEASGAMPLFLRDSAGNDWYEFLKTYRADTIKIAVDESGVIRQFDGDASAIVPYNMAVVEVAADKFPADVDTNGKWIVDGDKIIKRPPTPAELQATKTQLIKQASEQIEVLQFAAESGEATPEEMDRLTAWQQYRLQVFRVDINANSAIEWPVAPAAN